MPKKFSKAKVNYRKSERKELAGQERREGKKEEKRVESTLNDGCWCGRIYCDHDYKY